MMSHRSQRKRHLSKQTVTLIGIVIVIVICAIIAIKFGAIASADSKAKTSVTDTKANVTSETKKLNAVLASSATISSKSAAIDVYATLVGKYSADICKDARTLLYYNFLKMHDSCEQANLALFALSSSARNLRGFLADEETLATLLPKQTTNLTSVQNVDLWKRTTDLLRAAKTGVQASTLKQGLAQSVDAYTAAWNAVVQADAKKDEAAFNKATDLVKTAYKNVTSQSDVAKATLQELTGVLSGKYQVYLEVKYPQ